VHDQEEDPRNIPDIQEVKILFEDQDWDVLFDVYKQVGRSKDLLIETILNGG
jgi:hypothetical protein